MTRVDYQTYLARVNVGALSREQEMFKDNLSLGILIRVFKANMLYTVTKARTQQGILVTV